MKVGFYSNLQMRRNGSFQLRCHQPAQYLKAKGYDTRVGRIHFALPRKGEITVIHRAFADDYVLLFIAYARALGNVVVYDTDDLLFEASGSSYLVKIGNKYNRDYNSARKAMAISDAVTVSTNFLADRARKFVPKVEIMLNALSYTWQEKATQVYARRRLTTQKRTLTLAYLSGSSTHDGDFKVIEDALLRILRDFPQSRLLLVGPLQYSSAFSEFKDRVEHRDFIPYERFIDVFSEIDLNLVPLEMQHDFCQGKSELKYIEAGACGVPSLVSPTQPHLAAIEEGITSVFAQNGEWYDKIAELISEPAKVDAMSKAVREHILQNYTASVRSEDWHSMILKLQEQLGAGEPGKATSLRLALSRRRWLGVLKQRLRKISRSRVKSD